MLPGSWPRPGKVTSMVPLARSFSSATRSRRTRCISRAVWIDVFASLMRWPAAGRSAAESLPKPLSCSVSSPFLPSRRTRTSSKAARLADASTSASARSTSAARGSVTASGREAGLGFLCDGRKGRHVMYRKIGEHLAIDGETRLVQSVDQRAVAHSAQTRRGVDAGDPQRAELTLLFAPAAIGVLTGLDDRLLGGAEDLAPGVEIALCLLENFLVPPSRDDTAFNSCHCFLLMLSVRQQLLDAVHVGLVHLHLAAQLTLTLAGLLRQDMTTVGLTALEAVRRFAKTLRRSPFGFQLGHDRLLILWPCSQALPKNPAIPRRCRYRRDGKLVTVCRSLLFGPEHHDHLLAFHQRVLLDHRIRGEILRNPRQQTPADVLMHELTAAVTQCHLGLITLGQEADDVTQFDLVVRLFRPWTKLYFLDLNLLLLALRRVRLLVLFEQELAEIHHTNHRGLRHRRDLDEVQCLRAGHLQRLCACHDPCLASIRCDHPHRRCGDLLIAPYALRRCDTRSSKTRRPRLATSSQSRAVSSASPKLPKSLPPRVRTARVRPSTSRSPATKRKGTRLIVCSRILKPTFSFLKSVSTRRP